ncbi:glycerophosphodiester phosphodiesterase family protein [Humidisolicoccus flavus]|uniref:glycerophosphodiester phosphodiesterase family protein n=1 Tax=Humidisolicoccus flavus TaxID=3111414 RepID=UPI003252627D
MRIVWDAAVAALRLLRKRLLVVIVVSIAAQGFYAWVVLPLLLTAFQAALRSAGADGLSQASLPAIVSSPLTLIALLGILVLATFFAVIQIGMFSVVAHLGFSGQPASAANLLRGLLRLCRSLLSWQAVLFAGYALLLVPLSHVGVGSALTHHIAIPRFISGELTKTTAGATGYTLVILAFIYLGFRLAGTFAALTDGPLQTAAGNEHSQPVARPTVLRSMRASLRLTSPLQLPIAVVMLSVAGTATLAFILAALIGTLPVALATSGTAGDSVAGSTLALLVIVRFVLLGAAAAFLAFFFVALRRSSHASAPARVLRSGPAARDRLTRSTTTAVLAMFAFLAIPPIAFATITATVPADGPIVVAHRGYTGGGVENTIEAMEAAAEAGADVVEMDIQETADQEFVVIHDVNLQRLAGDSRSVFELEQAELAAMTVSQGDFSGTIPTLQAYLAVADELGMQLLVEVKPHGNEAPDFAARVVAEMERLDPDRTHMIQSLDVDVVDAIAIADPDRDVALVTGFQIGNAPNTSADIVAIEDWSYSDEMLASLRSNGTRLFIWTINDSELLRTYVASGVDGIITDQVPQAITIRELHNTVTNPVSRYLASVTNQFTLF